MKITEPNIKDKLKIVLDLSYYINLSRSDDSEICGMHVKNVFLENEDLSYLTFSGIVFENCCFYSCDFEKSSFSDVKFIKCDFSNSNFKDSYLNRCEFSSCKLVGTVFSDGIIRDLKLIGCNLSYGAFSKTSVCCLGAELCDFSNSEINLCKLKSFIPQDCKFCGTSFFKTPMIGIDFTTCYTDGIKVSDNFHELKGAIFTHMQASELASLLGIIIK